MSLKMPKGCWGLQSQVIILSGCMSMNSTIPIQFYDSIMIVNIKMGFKIN